MTQVFRRVLLLAVALGALSLALPGLASAQYREFSGKIDKWGSDEFIVDNRQGDKVKFKYGDYTTVEGEKESIDDVRMGDWVAVDWKMMDKPRKAYKIKVLPPREDDE